MSDVHITFYPARDQGDRLAALACYARSCGCQVVVWRPLNRPPGIRIATVSGPLIQALRIKLFSLVLKRSRVPILAFGEFAA